MDLQVIGVLILTAGVWTIYGGVSGFNPLDVLQKILKNPAQASTIVSASKTPLKVSSSSSDSTSDGATTGTSIQKFKIVCGFACHQKRGSSSPGVDFAFPVGTPVVTPVSGVLHTHAATGSQAGYYVELKTSDGYIVHFNHLSKFRDGLDGKTVSAGTVIGYSGGVPGTPGAGNSTGAHLHFDVRSPSGRMIDPIPFLSLRAVGLK